MLTVIKLPVSIVMIIIFVIIIIIVITAINQFLTNCFEGVFKAVRIGEGFDVPV